MGHMHAHNLSDFFIRRLYAKGRLSIKDCSEALKVAGETVHCSEGESDEDYMYRMGVGEVVQYLIFHDKGDYERERALPESTLDEFVKGAFAPRVKRVKGKRPKGPIIVPATELNVDQKRVLKEWLTHETELWDCGDDGNGGEYGLFDAIEWKFAPGWRLRYPNIPKLGSVTH